jgi:NADPH-dependent ferric siderophore reductase
MTDTSLATPPSDQKYRIERMRHETKRRLLTVARVAHVTPNMIRITLTGADLHSFFSGAYDDHIKLFFPRADGAPLAEDEKPIARDYTPRRYDPVAGELDVDFSVHDAGPATLWAMQAAVGQTLNIGGPRGSFVVTDDFDWYLFVGDETALPAIGRRLEELRPQAKVIVIAEVSDASEEQTFTSRASVQTIWLHRGKAAPGSTTLLDDAVAKQKLPSGDGYVWVACESLTAKRLRRILVEDHAHPKAWVKAAGYWKHGAANIHETHND